MKQPPSRLRVSGAHGTDLTGDKKLHLSKSDMACISLKRVSII